MQNRTHDGFALFATHVIDAVAAAAVVAMDSGRSLPSRSQAMIIN
jgi:hypothetical protein